MNIHEKYISRCIELGKLGIGNTYPNPSVGCCIVLDDKIIGEGNTSKAGGNHAEVNAINSVEDKSLLKLSTIYVTLVFGALSFGFSTYLIIIIGAGHNAKAHAISYMPFVLASIIYVTRGKYFLGFLFTTISLALQFTANHFQMTYYLGFIVISLAVWFVYQSIKSKNIDKKNKIRNQNIPWPFQDIIFNSKMNSSKKIYIFR